jgi:hypothetical protein
VAEIPEPPEVAEVKAYPLRNAADDAWAELQRLRAEATELGIEVSESWPIVRLREEIAKVSGG